MWEELENALAWYAAAPARWLGSARQDLGAAAEWLWIVLQGDFAEEQSTAQVVTGTVISMIPIVDQLCDVRDLVANCRKINADSSNHWAWIALVLTLIGLFPVLGSLAKGCCKILFAYGRKFAVRSGAALKAEGFWDASRPFVEAGIGKLNQHLQTPAVRRSLRALNIQNPPNTGTQVHKASVTLAGTPVNFVHVGGFDIDPAVNAPSSGTAVSSGDGYAVLTVGSSTRLYRVNLVTGALTDLGTIGNGSAAIQGLALQRDHIDLRAEHVPHERQQMVVVRQEQHLGSRRQIAQRLEPGLRARIVEVDEQIVGDERQPGPAGEL